MSTLDQTRGATNAPHSVLFRRTRWFAKTIFMQPQFKRALNRYCAGEGTAIGAGLDALGNSLLPIRHFRGHRTRLLAGLSPIDRVPFHSSGHAVGGRAQARQSRGPFGRPNLFMQKVRWNVAVGLFVLFQ